MLAAPKRFATFIGAELPAADPTCWVDAPGFSGALPPCGLLLIPAPEAVAFPAGAAFAMLAKVCKMLDAFDAGAGAAADRDASALR